MFKKIGIKLILAVGIAIIIIIMVFSYYNIKSQSDVLLYEMKRHSSQLSETIKNSTKYAMLLNRREHIREIIKTIGVQEFIKEIRIFDKEGMTIYSSDTSSVGIMVDKKGEACYACHSANQPLEILNMAERTRIFHLTPDSGRVLGIINAIYNEKSCWEADCHVHHSEQKVLGVLDITVFLSAIDEQIYKSKVKMLVFAIVVIISISSILWFFVWQLVEKPVGELLKATKHVAEGNLVYTISNFGKNELGILANSFNNMLSRLNEARRQLFQSDKMASLGKLAAGVAHEINNPLTGILTYSSFLLKRASTDMELKQDLEVIVRETKRSREIVKGLLDFARQSIPKKNSVDIKNLIEKVLKVIENQLSLKQIDVKKKYSEDIPNVIVDANQMQQVFINLIVNAIDAIETKKGKITIETKLIKLEPFGITPIKKAFCPKGDNLLDNNFKIETFPTIKLRAKYKNNEGYINIDPIYGKHRNYYGIQMKEQCEIEIACPKCKISLLDKIKKCPKCGSNVYFFEVPGKGKVEGCSRNQCFWQNWELVEKEGAKEFIEISVSDNGSGIEQEKLNKIFDPFFTTKGQKGTGLGLAVIWGIIDNHNGTIAVKTKLNQGTTFTIRLPSAKFVESNV